VPHSRRLTASLLIFALTAAVPLFAQESSDVREEVEVGRVIADVRVIDRRDAQPIEGLSRDDFRVEVDGRPVRLESSDWIVGATPSLDGASQEEIQRIESEEGPGYPSRLIVLFFQRHTFPSRIAGMMQMLKRADEFIATLGPDDRVAILTYTSHLKLYADFTNDHDYLSELIQRRIVPYRPPPPPEPGPFPSMAAHFDHEAAKNAATPEQALLVTAKALAPLRGSKTMLYIGWGMGVRIAGAVQMRPEYAETRRALLAARVTVFPLDVTRADYHSLEGPLIRVARDTGGYYMKTYYSSYFAMNSVASIITGRYEFVFEKPDLPPGEHLIKIRLTDEARDRVQRAGHKPWLFYRWYYDDRLEAPSRVPVPIRP
jgi:VWFA-related protein